MNCSIVYLQFDITFSYQQKTGAERCIGIRSTLILHVHLLRFCTSRVGLGKLLLALASTVILGSEPRGTHDHILLSHDSGCRATVTVENLIAPNVHLLQNRPITNCCKANYITDTGVRNYFPCILLNINHIEKRFK
jgi:hypothetical protein